MKNKEKHLTRIIKLLALWESNKNSHEGQSALLKINTLCKKYDITAKDIQEKQNAAQNISAKSEQKQTQNTYQSTTQRQTQHIIIANLSIKKAQNIKKSINDILGCNPIAPVLIEWTIVVDSFPVFLFFRKNRATMIISASSFSEAAILDTLARCSQKINPFL